MDSLCWDLGTNLHHPSQKPREFWPCCRAGILLNSRPQEAFPFVPQCSEYSGLRWPFFQLCSARAHSVGCQWHSCSSLPLEIFSMENISSELTKHGYHLPFTSCLSCGTNIKITHSWVAVQRFLVCFPLSIPNIVTAE